MAEELKLNLKKEGAPSSGSAQVLTKQAGKELKLDKKKSEGNLAQQREEKPIRYRRVPLLCFGPVGGDPSVLLKTGSEVILKREQDGTDYKWGIAAYAAGGQRLGFVPQDRGQSVARLMDAGKVITAEAVSLSDENFRMDEPCFLYKEDKAHPIVIYLNLPEEQTNE